MTDMIITTIYVLALVSAVAMTCLWHRSVFHGEAEKPAPKKSKPSTFVGLVVSKSSRIAERKALLTRMPGPEPVFKNHTNFLPEIPKHALLEPLFELCQKWGYVHDQRPGGGILESVAYLDKHWVVVETDDCMEGHDLTFYFDQEPMFVVGYWRGKFTCAYDLRLIFDRELRDLVYAFLLTKYDQEEQGYSFKKRRRFESLTEPK